VIRYLKIAGYLLAAAALGAGYLFIKG